MIDNAAFVSASDLQLVFLATLHFHQVNICLAAQYVCSFGMLMGAVLASCTGMVVSS
jgi:NhaP-type Na+/H+ or K+/H+ antiporter